MSKRHIQGDSGGLFQVRSYVVLMITTNKTGMLFWVMLVWATSVVSDGLTGSCSIYDNGGQPGTEPLDDTYPGLGSLGDNERIDHYGILCDLSMDPSGY